MNWLEEQQTLYLTIAYVGGCPSSKDDVFLWVRDNMSRRDKRRGTLVSCGVRQPWIEGDLVAFRYFASHQNMEHKIQVQPITILDQRPYHSMERLFDISDGFVFVVDADPGREEAMRGALQAFEEESAPLGLPMVLHYHASVEERDEDINQRRQDELDAILNQKRWTSVYTQGSRRKSLLERPLHRCVDSVIQKLLDIPEPQRSLHSYFKRSTT